MTYPLLRLLLMGGWFLPFCCAAQPTVRYWPGKDLLDITPYVAYLADSSETLTPGRVQQLPYTAFTPNGKVGLSLGSTHLPHWFRIDFADTIYAEDLYLYSDFPLRYLDIYLIGQDSSLRHWQTGVMRRFGGRDFLTNKYIVNLGKRPRQVFLRAQSPTLHLPLAVGTIQPLVNYTHTFDLWTGGLLALIMTLAVYNLFLFFSLRDRSFLYYAGYQVSLFYLVLRGIGLFQEYITPNAPWLNADNNTGTVISVGLTILFVSKFLNLRAVALYLWRWLGGIWLGLAGLLVCDWTLPYRAWHNDLTNALVVVHACSVIGCGAWLWYRGYAPAKYFTLAWFLFIAGVVVRFLSLSNVLPKSLFWIDYSAQIGIACESLLLSFAVAYRFNLFRQEARDAQALALQRSEENEKLLAEQNRMLEQNRAVTEALAQRNNTPVSPLQTDITALLDKLRHERGKGTKLAISTTEGVVLLPIPDIVRLEAFGSYCTVYLSNQKKIVASKPLADFEPLLDKADFARIHKSHIVNINFIERYIRGEGGMVVMPDGAEVSVSRLMKGDLLDRLHIS